MKRIENSPVAVPKHLQSVLGLQHVYQAAKDIAPACIRTPLMKTKTLSEMTDCDLCLKLESLQVSGSFKFRGAYNAILKTTEAAKKNGVVGVSTGNYGKALAIAANLQNIKPYICVSKKVPSNKIEGLKQAGASLIIHGESQDEAQLKVQDLIKEGKVEIPPFDHPDIIHGQATVGLEIIEDCPELDNVIVPVSGGGLATGVAMVLKTLNPRCRVIAVSMEKGAAMAASLEANHVVTVKEEVTIADSLGGGLGTNNQYTFPLAKSYFDELITVDEESIKKAIATLYQAEGIVCEGASAVPLAALLALQKTPYKVTGKTALVISGKNIDMKTHAAIIQQYCSH